MAFKDLREYIVKLEQERLLQRVEEQVDWNLEVGAIIKRCCELGAPAPLFENVKGYPRGHRILGSPVGPSSEKGRLYARLAIALGLSPDASAEALVEHFIERKHLPPIKPRLVNTGPCKENIQVGESVDLFKLPVPYIHQYDGGRYIGTWHLVVTKDPDTGWVNWGMYRLMVHDGKTMGGLIIPTQHIGIHYAKYEERGQPMPFAVAVGTEPLASLIASAVAPVGVDEADVIGAFRGEPIEVVKCETVDLEVPATAEIVIEGFIPPQQRRQEGPFGEYTGYQGRASGLRPVYQITAVTHRNDPIIPVVAAGTPVEDHLCISIVVAADILHDLREADLPVAKVFIPPAAAQHLIVVSVKAKPPYIAKKVADAIWATKSGYHIPKIVVVDDDVDATDINQVLWAFCSRNHPDTGIIKVPNAAAFPLWSFLHPEEKDTLTTTKVVFDCTWPGDRSEDQIPRKASFDSLWPQDIQEKVLRKWREYGFSTE